MSIGNYLTALDEQRDALARNLVTMGVQASESEKLNTLVPKVLQIPQAKQDIKRETFDVVFYLDFEGNALDPEVVRLMTILEEEMKYFKFLGNYKHFD